VTWWRDPWRRSVALAGGLVLAGFVAIALAWVGVSATRSVPEQVAFAVSGGMGGLALAGTGAALFDIQRRRLATAEERRDFAGFAERLAGIAESIAARGAVVPPAPAPRSRRRAPLRAR